ncbi:MAG: peroxidase family protein [Candidatus Rokubacteria bacterium]|nr:peroxidase family protein [Candidatus Rokubacteria bacterium]
MTASAACPINSRFARVGILSLLLIALAHIGAEDAAWYATRAGWTPVHTLTYYRVIFTIWATAILLTPALCFFILFKPGAVESHWRAFWTFSYVAFLSHLYWTVIATFHGNFREIFHSQSWLIPKPNPERIVDQPWPDLVLTLWWGLDIALLWLVRGDIRWIRLQRGAVHLVAFTMFVGALMAPKASRVAHILGMVMATTVVSTYMARLVFRQPDPKSLGVFLYVTLYRIVNRLVIWRRLVWHRMPLLLAIGNLDALREVLRAKNLHNTSDIPVSRPEGLRPDTPYNPAYLYSREPDGMYNDLAKAGMGSASLNPRNPSDTSDFMQSSPGARFGRNIPLSEVDPRRAPPLLEPNPWEVSNALLSRPPGRFVPATSLNLLAAAWIQFQVHDWFNHGTPIKGNEIEVPTRPGDPRGCPMRIRRTRPDPTRVENDGNGPTTFVNAESHWWDGSQIYGSSDEAVARCRAGKDGKLDLGPDGLLVMEQNGLEKTGLSANWWLGLSLMHNLFAKEHNAICDHLKLEYPGWDDDQLYRTARLVNVALMAKIHTVEWTPAILGHPALQVGMKGNWWGFASERIKKAFRRISESELVSGIPGSVTDHHGADYCLTEEFVSVYRMHALMPDSVDVHAVANGEKLKTFILGSETDRDPLDVVGPFARTRALAGGAGMADLFYSFGIANPGALVLHNYPEWMRRLQRRNNDGSPDEVIDLAAIDILRDRERGVPRYNRFRELFHMRRVKSFEELTSNPEWAKEIKKAYGDVDNVDLMVGMYAETPPLGFGISDTAFRVFILMASRRLKSDRFFTTDYTPEIYSRAGLDWVENNGMRTVLLRHYPVLAAALYHVQNPFSPWRRVEKIPEVVAA